MTKASSHSVLGQAAKPDIANFALPPGPTFLTPERGYSVLHATVYDHLADNVWLPGDSLLLNFDADFGPFLRNIRRCRRLLNRQLRQTISPRRKRQIRAQRAVFAAAQARVDPMQAGAGR